MDLEKKIRELIREILMEELKEEKILFFEEDSEKVKYKYEHILLEDNYFFSTSQELNMNNYSKLVIPEISLNEFIQVSKGLSSNLKTKLIIDSFLLNKEVILISEGMEYRKFKSTININFYQYLKDIEDILVSYGVKIVPISYLEEELKGRVKRNKEVEFSEEREYKFSKGVLTESKVESLKNKGYRKIQLGKEAILTPLASDFIRYNNMEVLKEAVDK